MKTSVNKSFVFTLLKQKAAPGICALALGIALNSYGQSVGINFAGRQWSIGGNTPMTLDAADTAGVVSRQNWNNVYLDGANSGGTAQLNQGGADDGIVIDSSGASTDLTFSYTANGNATEWAVGQSTYTGNQQLLNGYWDIQSASGSVDIGNITYGLYDIYVYVSADNNGRTAGVSLNGGGQTYLLTDANGYDYSQPLIQATAATQDAATDAQYVLYQNVTGTSFQLDLYNYGQDVGLAGIQIVEVVPEPSTLALSVAGLALFGLMIRRRAGFFRC